MVEGNWIHQPYCEAYLVFDLALLCMHWSKFQKHAVSRPCLGTSVLYSGRTIQTANLLLKALQFSVYITETLEWSSERRRQTRWHIVDTKLNWYLSLYSLRNQVQWSQVNRRDVMIPPQVRRLMNLTGDVSSTSLGGPEEVWGFSSRRRESNPGDLEACICPVVGWVSSVGCVPESSICRVACRRSLA